MWVCFEGPVGCLLCGLRVDAVVGGKCRVRHCAGAVTLYTTGNGLQYHVLRMGYVWLRKDGSVNALLLVLVVVVVVVVVVVLVLVVVRRRLQPLLMLEMMLMRLWLLLWRWRLLLTGLHWLCWLLLWWQH